MEGLRSLLRGFASRSLGLPDKAQCPRCMYYDITDPDVIAKMREVGRNLDEAGCRCDLIFHSERIATRERWANSGIPHRGMKATPCTFESFVQCEGAEEAYEAAVQMASRKGPPMLVLQGQKGTGKSHLLEAIGRRWLHDDRSCRYDLVADLLRSMRSTFGRDDSQGTLDQIYQERVNTGVLLLDDLGLEKPSDWVVEQVTALVDKRYREAWPMVIATNKTKAEVEESLGYRLASRMWDRTGAVRLVMMTCGDYREG